MKNIFVLRNKLKLSYLNIGKILGVLLILSFLVFVLYNTVKNFVFFFDDDALYVLHHIYDNHIYLGDRIGDIGTRFLPLQFFDYNILRIFNYDLRYGITPYYLVLKYILSIILFVYIIKDIEKYNKKNISFPIKLLLILFFTMFHELTFIVPDVKFSELTQGLLCLLFIFAYQRGYFTNKLKYYVIALLSCVYATYMKETMFIPFFIIGLSSLLFLKGNKNKPRGGVNLLLILNGIVYLIGYYIVYRSYYNGFWNSSVKDEQYYKSYFYLFYFLIFFTIIRGYNFFKKWKIEFYDNFLLASLGFTFALLILGLKWLYYYWIPHIFLSVFLIYYITKCSKYTKYLVCMTMIFSIFMNFKMFRYIFLYKQWVRLNTISFIQEHKDKDIIMLNCNDLDKTVYNSYYKYIFNENKDIITFCNYTDEDIKYFLNNKLLNKEYLFSIPKDISKEKYENFVKNKYELRYSGFQIYYDHFNVFILTPVK